MYYRMHIAYFSEVTVRVVLNHTIVPAADRHAAATFFADLLGLTVGGQVGPFAPVRVNDDLTLDFDDRATVVPSHYGFLVDDDTFDALLRRLARQPEVDFGSGVEHGWDRAVNQLAGGRGVYVLAPDGHSYEFFTAAP
ncbi:VOC family protein [Nocardia brasiliensis]|nr:VOC family protein [Nocardia brasiliensis]